MSAIPQQVLARQKATVNSLVAAQSAMFAGFEKLVDLNLKVVRATLDEVAQQSQQAAELKDPQDVASFTSGLVQPGAEKALAYGKHVYDIVAGVQAELAQLAEAQIAEGQQRLRFADQGCQAGRRSRRKQPERRRQCLFQGCQRRRRGRDQGRGPQSPRRLIVPGGCCDSPYCSTVE
ncbi:granule-associated protein (phasin) [Bordetella pertussis]|nr:granule-associated protein (phasin) [Bordetella pertussis]